MYLFFTHFFLLLWYAAQAYILAACVYVIASTATFIGNYQRIRRLFRRNPDQHFPAPSTHFTLLIPAHNEARLLPQLLASIQQLRYSPALFEAVVIADNCTDDTAAIAWQARPAATATLHSAAVFQYPAHPAGGKIDFVSRIGPGREFLGCHPQSPPKPRQPQNLMSPRGISVLMYHALVEKLEAGLSPLHLDVDQFEQQLAWLHRQGYAGITATDLFHHITHSSSANKFVVFTFGYLSLLTLAAPLLRKYGFAATLFLTTGFVGETDFSAVPAFARDVPVTDRPLTWPEIQALKSLGWDIQAHSHTHQPHAALPLAALAVEMQQSRQAIAEALGSIPTLYAFPYGSYNRPALAALAPAGYEAGFSVHNGQAVPHQ